MANEKNILRLACLIDRTGEERFCKGVEEVAQNFADITAGKRGRSHVLSR